jgi:serine/threonine protein kinase
MEGGAAAGERTDDPRVGTLVLGKLRVERVLGAGGMGTVYEVLHELTRSRMALKVLHPERAADGDAVVRFVREAGALGELESPALPRVFDVGRLDDGSAYLLMELLRGETLRALLAREGRVSGSRAARIVRDALMGLAVVHERGIVHRDLKPDNVLVAESPAGPTVKLLDFGAYKRLEAEPDGQGSLTSEGHVVGTIHYLSPERLDGGGERAPSADLWSLGVVLYELVTGELPFQGKTAAAVARTIARCAPSPPRLRVPSLSPELERVIARALAADPASRFRDARAFADALAPIADDHLRDVVDGRFEVLGLLGSGAMGTVHEVLDRETGAHRALKRLATHASADASRRARFEREAALLAEIEHPHVARVLGSGVDPATDAPYLVLERLEGSDLATLLERDGRLSPSETIELVRQLAEGLDAVHARGVVHRDLKPGNVFVRRTGAALHVTLLDFGVAKLLDDDGLALTRDTGAPGTPLTMAPEQASGGAVGPAADRYALGHVAFAALVGRAYFAEESARGLLGLLRTVAEGVVEPASVRAARAGVALPQGFDGWFARATALAPSARFPSARALAEALACVLPRSDEALVHVDAPVRGTSDTFAAPLAETHGGGSRAARGRAWVAVGLGVAGASLALLAAWPAPSASPTPAAPSERGVPRAASSLSLPTSEVSAPPLATGASTIASSPAEARVEPEPTRPLAARAPPAGLERATPRGPARVPSQVPSSSAQPSATAPGPAAPATASVAPATVPTPATPMKPPDSLY